MNDNLKLHDIKNIVEIPDTSIFIFIILCFFSLLVLLSIIFLVIKYFKNKKLDVRKDSLNRLKNIEYINPKKNAYNITKELRIVAKSPKEMILANEIIEDLEQYKYKKKVCEIENSIKIKIDRFTDIVDV